MYEKYNAYEIGVGGGGGEYTPQIGFGWSNGVSLVMLNYTYSENYQKNNSNDDDDSLSEVSIALISCGVILFVLLLCGGLYYYFTRLQKEKNNKNEKITTSLVNKSNLYNHENMT